MSNDLDGPDNEPYGQVLYESKVNGNHGWVKDQLRSDPDPMTVTEFIRAGYEAGEGVHSLLAYIERAFTETR